MKWVKTFKKKERKKEGRKKDSRALRSLPDEAKVSMLLLHVLHVS